jgi:hypothetical protein
MVVGLLKLEGCKREIVWLGILMLFADFVVGQEKSFSLKVSAVIPLNVGLKNARSLQGANLLGAGEPQIGELNLEKNKKRNKYME